MMEEQDIKVIGIDKENIRENADGKGWVIPFKLSTEPNESWAKHFFEVHRKNTDIKKYNCKLLGKMIEVGFTDTDSQQKALDALNKDVATTNTVYKEVYLAKKKMQEDMMDMKQKRGVTLQKLKDESDNLKF